MFLKRFLIAGAFAGAALAACGGGGAGARYGVPSAPVPAPVASNSPQGNLAVQDMVAGQAAWVDPSTHRTLYFLDVDTAAGGTCVNACLSLWPVFKPNAAARANASMTIITRSDGTGMQWAFQGHPLYTFTGDSGPDQANGDNFPEFGGHWHVARP